jgi:hypothetical protein
VAFRQSRLVLANEAHDGLRRSIRTRQIGLRLVRAASDLGVRHLAMEALYDAELVARANRTRELPAVEGGYLAQPEMRELITVALELGWTLIAYEADIACKPEELASLGIEETNWREGQQAHNLAEALFLLPDATPLLVWSGNHHLAKNPAEDWMPMGSRLESLCGINPFAIDQTLTVSFDRGRPPIGAKWAERFSPALTERGGTAGFLADEAPPAWPCPDLADAFLLSSDNHLT